jgi:N-acetyl-anhydromuramyl-L-alanine amidase AmpD
MKFKKKFEITKKYLTTNTKRRPGLLISPSVKFIVAHDTGNPTSTAKNNVDYYERTNNEATASAHIFVDDKEIIECIPAMTVDKPEKAWHVRYNVSKDNELYGYEANDTAIGVEYCFGSNINATESYKRYIWVIASLCFKFGLNPKRAVVGHFILDPGRKTDPVNGLKFFNKSYNQLLSDIAVEYDDCLVDENNQPVNKKFMKLIQNQTSRKIYAVGADNKKHWIFNEVTFNTGRDMGMWGDWNSVETVGDDGYEEGHTIFLVK